MSGIKNIDEIKKKIESNEEISSDDIKTLEDAENTIAKNKQRLQTSSFDTDDFFEAALKRSAEHIRERARST